MLMTALTENPIHCLDCGREVDPGAIALPEELVEAVAHWNWIAGAIERLELDSGPYEKWAEAQLLDPASPVNREGLELRGLLEATRRCYFVFFQQMTEDLSAYVVPDSCPGCGSPLGKPPQGTPGRRVCEPCSVVLLNG